MWPVTQDFIDKVMNPSGRQIFGKIQVHYTDPFIDQSINVEASENSNISMPAQTADSVEEPHGKIISLDGTWRLGEGWVLADPSRQVGWWGTQLSNSNAEFSSPYPSLTITHASRPIHSLKVVGDSVRGEYPVNFAIKLYATDGTLLYTETVTGNDQVRWSKTLFSPVLDVAKQELVISKWSHAGRKVKILEFFTSISETYEGNDILRINLLEEREVSSGSLPVGNISANEIDIKLYNRNRKFDAGNRESPLYQTIKANRRIKAWLGAEAENAATENPPTFTRNSVAYLSDGTQVAANQPRFEPGKFGKAVMVEEGTTNTLDSYSYAGDTRREETSLAILGLPAYKIYLIGNNLGHLRCRFNMTQGNRYTCSFFLHDPNNRFLNARLYDETSGFFEDSSGTIQVTPEIKRIWVSGIAPATKITSHGIALYWKPDSVSGDEYWIAGVQAEAKPYPTSFTDGTRARETLAIPTAGVLNPQEGTIECWVLINDVIKRVDGTPRRIFHVSQGEGIEMGLALYHNFNTNEWFLSINESTAGRVSDELTPNGWNYFAVTYAEGLAKLYINGIPAAIKQGAQLPILGGDLYVGSRNDNTRHCNTLIDDLRISSRARTDEEILAAYQSGQPLQRDKDTTYLLSFNGSIYPVEQCWVPLGVFWSGNWKVPENDMYAQTSGRDRLELLRKSTYSSSQVKINTTLYDLAVDVFTDAGLSPSEYFVDPELQNFLVPYAYFESQSHREALRKIAEACLGQCYCDREGIVRMEGPSYLEGQESKLTITPAITFRKDNPVKYDQIANYIEVETQPLRPATAAEEVYRSNEAISVPAGSTKSLTLNYNNKPCIEASASLEGATNTTIQDVTYYAWGADVTLYNPGGSAENVILVVDAKPLKVINKEKAIARDEASIQEHGELRYVFPENPLVQSLDVAQDIADKLLAFFKDPQRDVTLEWIGNPALTPGDRISVKDKQETNDYFVTKQELEYLGYLRGRNLEGRKA